MKITRMFMPVLFVLLGLSCGYAQDKPAAQPPTAQQPVIHIPLKVQLTLSDYDGTKKISSMPYTLMLVVSQTDKRDSLASIRIGSRVPVATQKSGENGTQYQYLDVGVSIDTVSLREIGHQLAIQLKTEVSSVAESAPSSVSGLPNDPVIRQNVWQGSVLIPIGKATVAFSSDAIDSKGGMQLVVTATLIQ